MSGVLSFLLRGGGSILRDSAEIFVGQALVRAVARKLKGLLLFYGVLAVFALAALIFLYVLLYRWLSLLVGDVGSAAILCGAHILIILIMLSVRAIMNGRPAPASTSPLVEMIKAHAESLGGPNGSFGAGVEIGKDIGKDIGKHIRKAAPQIAIAAAVVGLVIGLRPGLLSAFRRRDTTPK